MRRIVQISLLPNRIIIAYETKKLRDSMSERHEPTLLDLNKRLAHECICKPCDKDVVITVGDYNEGFIPHCENGHAYPHYKSSGIDYPGTIDHFALKGLQTKGWRLLP